MATQLSIGKCSHDTNNQMQRITRWRPAMFTEARACQLSESCVYKPKADKFFVRCAALMHTPAAVRSTEL